MFEHSFHQYSQFRLQALKNQIAQLSEDAISARSMDQLIQEYTQNYLLKMVNLELDEKVWQWHPVDNAPELPRQEFLVLIPFSGNGLLFSYHGPNSPVIRNIMDLQGEL